MEKRETKIKILLSFYPISQDEKNQATEHTYSIEELQQKCKNVCKPCWELRYCPYGPLIEGFPLLPFTKKDTVECVDFMSNCLKKTGCNQETIQRLKKWYSSSKNDYAEIVPPELKHMSCNVFGHLCPVFFAAEGCTETKDTRKKNRSIPRDVMVRVIRRDDATCQLCSKKLLDREIQLDHVIPLSKGGQTAESNLRVLCKLCNQQKGNRLDADKCTRHFYKLT